MAAPTSLRTRRFTSPASRSVPSSLSTLTRSASRLDSPTPARKPQFPFSEQRRFGTPPLLALPPNHHSRPATATTPPPALPGSGRNDSTRSLRSQAWFSGSALLAQNRGTRPHAIPGCCACRPPTGIPDRIRGIAVRTSRLPPLRIPTGRCSAPAALYRAFGAVSFSGVLHGRQPCTGFAHDRLGPVHAAALNGRRLAGPLALRPTRLGPRAVATVGLHGRPCCGSRCSPRRQR
jgi:hypothetical protein